MGNGNGGIYGTKVFALGPTIGGGAGAAGAAGTDGGM